MELLRHTVTNQNISTTEKMALDYTYNGEAPVEVLARLDVSGLAGLGVVLSINIYINNVLMIPSSQLSVPSGRTAVVVTSRPFPIVENDQIVITILGGFGDTAVNITSSLRDISAAKKSELVGIGQIPVDHDYPSEDYLRYTSATGNGINGAIITVYRRDDYDSGNRSETFVVGRSSTNENGDWKNPIFLDPGSYTFVFAKAGFFGPDVVNLAVS